MRLLAIDLAWSGPSGWVDWVSGHDDPILNYGQFQAPSPKKKGIERDLEMTVSLFTEIRIFFSDLESVPPIIPYRYDRIIFEYTDWHRSITGKNAKREYAIERRAQRTLGMAVSTLTLVAKIHAATGLLMPLGANEARREFGAARKDAAAHLWAEQYPRFEFKEHKTGFLFDTKLKQNISGHISDAFVLAAVADNRLRLAEKIDAVGRSE